MDNFYKLSERLDDVSRRFEIAQSVLEEAMEESGGEITEENAELLAEAEELEAIKSFNDKGGVLIVTGSGDSNDKLSGVPHMAATQNALLEYIGSDLRLADDGTY